MDPRKADVAQLMPTRARSLASAARWVRGSLDHRQREELQKLLPPAKRTLATLGRALGSDRAAVDACFATASGLRRALRLLADAISRRVVRRRRGVFSRNENAAPPSA